MVSDGYIFTIKLNETRQLRRIGFHAQISCFLRLFKLTRLYNGNHFSSVMYCIYVCVCVCVCT